MLYGKEHVKRYQETDGEEGYDWENGTTILLLHTKGRKSGKERIHPLIFREWEGDYLVVASKGGDDDDPDWYQNLQEDPEVEVQIKGDKFQAKARTATPSEKPAMWAAHGRGVAGLLRLPEEDQPQHPRRGARARVTGWGHELPRWREDRR